MGLRYIVSFCTMAASAHPVGKQGLQTKQTAQYGERGMETKSNGSI